MTPTISARRFEETLEEVSVDVALLESELNSIESRIGVALLERESGGKFDSKRYGQLVEARDKKRAELADRKLVVHGAQEHIRAVHEAERRVEYEAAIERVTAIHDATAGVEDRYLAALTAVADIAGELHELRSQRREAEAVVWSYERGPGRDSVSRSAIAGLPEPFRPFGLPESYLFYDKPYCPFPQWLRSHLQIVAPHRFR